MHETNEYNQNKCLDLATLFRALQDIAPCQEEDVVSAKIRVDNFVNAYYYERDKDLFEWLGAGNSVKYERWHLRNLVQFGVGAGKSQMTKNKLLKTLEQYLV